MLIPVNAQQIEKDLMICTWNFSPKEGVEMTDLKSFVLDEFIPAYTKHYSKAKFHLCKSDRGANKDSFSILVVFKSVDARNAYWPQQGVASEAARKAAEKTKAVDEKFQEMAEMDSWNDWLVL
jgi:hypothetical protein